MYIRTKGKKENNKTSYHFRGSLYLRVPSDVFSTKRDIICLNETEVKM